MSTSFHISVFLALGEWSHNHDFLGHEDLFCIVLLCILYSAYVRSIPFLSFIVPIFAWNILLVISNFLEEISSLSHSVIFLYFLALITEEGFLFSPCYSLELYIQMGYLSFSPLPLASLLLSACKPPQTTILPFCISISWGWSWKLPPVQCPEPLSIFFRYSIRSNPLNLYHFHCIIIRDWFRSYLNGLVVSLLSSI